MLKEIEEAIESFKYGCVEKESRIPEWFKATRQKGPGLNGGEPFNA